VGWAAGFLMPYLTAGVAFGNLDSRATTAGTWQRIDVSAPPARTLLDSGNFSGVVGRRGITYGGVIGAGLDMQLLPNTFLRAEWQYIQFASGGERPDTSVNTARVAGGVKF
jgi:opacity protein-like surface antigen